MAKPFKRYTKDPSGKQVFRGWYIWFTDHTRTPPRKLVSLKTKDRSVARDRANDLLSKYSRGKYDPWEQRSGSVKERQVRTLSDAFQFVLETRYSGARPNTLSIVRKSYTWFQRHVGNRDVGSITPFHIRTFLAKYKPSTRHRLHGTLKTFFHDLHQFEIIDVNPMEKVEKPPSPPSRVRFLTEEEETRLLHCCYRAWLRNAIIIGIETGCRSGEIRNLRWEDIDFEGGLIHVRAHGDFQTKSGKDRVVPLTDRLREHLLTIPRVGPYLVYQDEAPDVPIPDSTIIHRMKRTTERAKLKDVSMHVLRHTYSSRCVQRGLPIYILSKVLGHADFKTTTSVYSHLDTGSIVEWVDRVMNRKENGTTSPPDGQTGSDTPLPSVEG